MIDCCQVVWAVAKSTAAAAPAPQASTARRPPHTGSQGERRWPCSSVGSGRRPGRVGRARSMTSTVVQASSSAASEAHSADIRFTRQATVDRGSHVKTWAIIVHSG